MMSPINENLMSARKWSQMVFLIPMYILQLSYGMHSGFPAILTPQLRDKNCDRFIIDDNEESWIGMYSKDKIELDINVCYFLFIKYLVSEHIQQFIT